MVITAGGRLPGEVSQPRADVAIAVLANPDASVCVKSRQARGDISGLGGEATVAAGSI